MSAMGKHAQFSYLYCVCMLLRRRVWCINQRSLERVCGRFNLQSTKRETVDIAVAQCVAIRESYVQERFRISNDKMMGESWRWHLYFPEVEEFGMERMALVFKH